MMVRDSVYDHVSRSHQIAPQCSRPPRFGLPHDRDRTREENQEKGQDRPGKNDAEDDLSDGG